MRYKSIPRHPMHLLKGYKLFLEGASDNEISRFVSEAELSNIRQFHECVIQGAHFYHAGMKAKIERYISKRMLIMYNENKAGFPVPYNGKRVRENHPRLSLTFSLMLDGLSDYEMIEMGCLESEIKTAKNVMYHMSHQDLLISQLAERTDTTRTTATRLKKIYNDKRNSVSEQNTMVHYEQQIAV
jgi:hypothetical protein